MIHILFLLNGQKLNCKRIVGMKNAYCILAHNEPYILETLISLLDDTDNDIYIHLDKKADCFSENAIAEAAKKSNITFIPRLSVGWGGGEYD